jgi:hypothetical protein
MARQTDTPSEPITITAFKLHTMSDRSKVAMIGRNTNYKVIFKAFRPYFENAEQVKEILENLPSGTFLVIDETSPNSRLEDIVFYYTP